MRTRNALRVCFCNKRRCDCESVCADCTGYMNSGTGMRGKEKDK